MNFTVTNLPIFNGELILSGLFTNAGGISAGYIARSNGQTWSPVGNGLSDGVRVYALAFYNYELYAGGSFASNGGNAGD
jgi:hypothetical protein